MYLFNQFTFGRSECNDPNIVDLGNILPTSESLF